MGEEYQLEAEAGIPLKATFSNDAGFSLKQLSLGKKKTIVAVPKGSLIGPHFAARNPATIPTSDTPPGSDEGADPLYHGIARYAPWNISCNGRTLTATLSSKDQWGNKTHEEWEGQVFEMKFEASFVLETLQLRLSVVSAADSLVGFEVRSPHSPHLEIKSSVHPSCIQEGGVAELPHDWGRDHQGNMRAKIAKPCDLAFHPYPNPLSGTIDCLYPEYTLRTMYRCAHQENGWLLRYRENNDFVSIIPITSQNPWRPNLSVSALDVHLTILSTPNKLQV